MKNYSLALERTQYCDICGKVITHPSGALMHDGKKHCSKCYRKRGD